MGLKGLDIEMPIVNKKNFHVFHIFAVSHPRRELILKKMRSKLIIFILVSGADVKILQNMLLITSRHLTL